MWAVAYVVGATANQNLFLAIHEISHNLAFRSARANRVLAVVANLGIGVPYSASFRVSKLACFCFPGLGGVRGRVVFAGVVVLAKCREEYMLILFLLSHTT